VRLDRDIEVMKGRHRDDASALPWNTYFDELIERGPRPHTRRA
jgi:hypothetical protein